MASNINRVVVGTACLMANLLVAFYAISMNDTSVHAENSLLENFQAACLASCVLAYLCLMPATQDQRLVFMAVALLCFSFLLRELDLERLNVPLFLQTLGSGRGRVLLLASLWISLIAYTLRSIDLKILSLEKVLRSRMFRLLAAAFGLLLVSALMDKNVFGLVHSRLFEELLEANAYLLIMLPLTSITARFLERYFSVSKQSDTGRSDA
ncbi:MAG: hypothetical protein AB8B57_10615 [Congregibacter sp.]